MRLRRCALVLCVIAAVLWPVQPVAQETDDAVWKAFLAWYKAAPMTDSSPFTGYPESLRADGIPAAEAERRMKILWRLIGERTDWIECYFDKVFSRPLTGDPATDRMSTAPAALLTRAIEGRPPGAALDAGMGQGRNAVYLASQGWKVTGFDVSAGAIAAAKANANKAGVRIDAVKASYEDFDFGIAKWDLIVLIFAWAPMDDEAFVAKLRTSLKPKGRIVFEHFFENPAAPRPPAMHALRPGQLREMLKGFRLERYEELTDLADWGGPGMQVIRAVAVKP